jgi:hypothetical protein
MATAAETAAVLDSPDEASHAAVQSAVNELLGSEVMLAGNAFETSSIVTMEHLQFGRVMERPLRLRLVTTGSDCILISDRDDARKLIDGVSCRPL